MGLPDGTVSRSTHVTSYQRRQPKPTKTDYRPIDSLVAFSKMHGSLGSASGSAPVRYAVRQVLDQEYRQETMRKQSGVLTTKPGLVKSASEQGGATQRALKEGLVKRDFFGRVIQEPVPEKKDTEWQNPVDESSKAGRKVWVTYHEGFSNAVRKPISMGELLAGL